MSNFQEIFKRIEVKYLLDETTYRRLRERLKDMAEVDRYGESSILNIYYDTPDYRLIRTSLEKPLYKEKLRLRSYGTPNKESAAFIEIKKKYDGVVYKRRIDMKYADALDYLNHGIGVSTGNNNEMLQSNLNNRMNMDDSINNLIKELATDKDYENPIYKEKAVNQQIKNEIDSMRAYYKNLQPMMAISYDRIAMFGKEDPELRITFDRNIRYRTDRLDLRYGNVGTDILKPNQRLMELKIAGAMPIKLARIFSELRIYPVSFSKYGRGYVDMMKTSAERKPNVAHGFEYTGEEGAVAYAG
ncbi:MAG: polyphosphate polymerase domain-containing protein [Eubacterium sp.]|nr:polyphosphate polymerase domain-containing protein [Eubacterium sp.]